jgi:hypothetical protein
MNIFNKVLKIGTAAVCVATIGICLSACGKKNVRITKDDIDIYSYTSLWEKEAVSPTMEDNKIKIDVASDVIDIEFDFQKFFTANPEYIGKNLYLTRDDIKKGDGTLIKGYAWKEVETGTAGSRKYKKLGDEDNEEVEAKTKTEIMGLEDNEGEIRLYVLSDGSYVTYIDSTPESNLESGEKNVTFRIHGNSGKVAVMKVLVNKAE